jgi:transglutaminase-like putative cysteine protease
LAKALIFIALCLAACVLLNACGDGGSLGSPANSGGKGTRPPDAKVLKVSQPGKKVKSNTKAVLDYSNIKEGYFCVKSKLGKTKVKVLVDKDDSLQYQYTIQNTKDYITIPLSLSNGSYKIGVWENIVKDKYAQIFTMTIDAKISDKFDPFLYPNQFVNFAKGDASTKLSTELATGADSDLDAINSIYDWVVENVTYDNQKAVTVVQQTGYLPDNTDTISTKTGICFDYAVLTASLLREQGIPAKLVIGYAGSAYHAWIEVASTEAGKVETYNLKVNEFVRMDPTFNAASKGKQDLSSIIGDGNNYRDNYYY